MMTTRYGDVATLFARYCHCLDAGDGAAWAALFTEDGEFVRPDEVHRGRAALRAFAENRDHASARHFTLNIAPAPDPEPDGSLSVRSDFFVISAADGTATFSAVGRYADTLVRVDDAFVFRRRVVSRLV